MLTRLSTGMMFCLVSLSFTDGSEALAADEVRLAWAQSIQCPPVSGCYRREGLSGVVEVENIAFRKVVEVVYKSPWSQTWQTVPATYLAPARDGFEAWTFAVIGPVEAFAFSYQVEDQQFWDNNEGKDYRPIRYQNDAFLGTGLSFAGLSGFLNAESRVLKAFLIVDPNHGRDISVLVQDGSIKQGFSARRALVFGSGLELWESQGLLESETKWNDLRLSVTSDQEADNNYGVFYRLNDGLIGVQPIR